MITGVLAGPHGLGMVKAVNDVEALADLGIILLLFTIGMEFSLRQLLRLGRSVLLGGALQVVFTILAASLIMVKTGSSWDGAIFIGFLFSLSSTAIVLKLMQDRSEMDTPHGRNILGILLFQDIAVIPMMMFAPVLAGTANGLGSSPFLLLGKIALILIMIYISARWLVPLLLHQIARQQSPQLFLITIVTICLAVAWFTSSLGISVSLGAFLAGLIISESEFSLQALSSILPFRDVFTSIFFISVGMLFNIEGFLLHPVILTAASFGVLAGKALIAGLVVMALGFPLRTAVITGMALGQVGEFSFILARVGIEQQILSSEFYQFFIIISVLTMAITPFSINLAPRMAGLFLRLPLPERIKTGMKPDADVVNEVMEDHLVIIGFGVNGRNLARVAAASGIAHIVVDMNPDTVRQAREDGEPIFYGDATQVEVLERAFIHQARVAVLAISDPRAAIRITDLIHRNYSHVYIIVRTRYIQEIHYLYEVGANEVIPEEFETSVEIFTLVLKKYLVPQVDIEKFITEVRADGYEMLRSLSKKSPSLQDIKLHFHDAEIYTIRVEDGSPVAGKTLAEIDLRSKYGVSVLVIQRGVRTLVNPGRDTRLEADDQAVLLGSPDIIKNSSFIFCKLNKR